MNIEALLNLIEQDAEKGGLYDRYPVRFLSMSYEEGTSAALMRLRQNIANAEFFDIQNILPYDDAWITMDHLRKAIYDLGTEKNYIIVGFSEYSRFLSQVDFITLVISLLELENPEKNQKRRIYIPCFALYSQLKKTVKQYHRRLDAYNPLINDTDIEDLPRIYFLEDHLDFGNHNNEVDNSAEWFGMWRNSDIDTSIPIICRSKTLLHFYGQASHDNVYNIKRIQTYCEMLGCMFSVHDIKEYKKEPEQFFKRFLDDIRNTGIRDINELILHKVNTRSIDESNLYQLWRANDIYTHWLIQNYILRNCTNDTYIYNVMNQLEDLSDSELIETVYEYVFDTHNKAFCEERKRIILSFKKANHEIRFTDRMIAYYNTYLCEIIKRKTTESIDKIDLTKDSIIVTENSDVLSKAVEEEVEPFLTDASQYERQLVIWLYRMHLIKEEDIRNIYPNFADYIEPYETEADPDEYAKKFDTYFSAYRKSRIQICQLSVYEDLINSWNKNSEKFYSWYTDSDIEYADVAIKKKDFAGNVYVLDAVGAEYLGYIIKLLEKKGENISYNAYTKCHIPSITSQAKDFYSNEYKWVSDYDTKVVHGGIYYPVPNLEMSLEMIDELISKIILAEGDEPFAITADHGSTVGHKICKKEKKYNFEKADHDGRCYQRKDGSYVAESDDYLLYQDDFSRNWVVALNSQSLYSNSKYAVHGGATLEEVIVPVIIAQKRQIINMSFRVKADRLKVSGLQKTVAFKIAPNPQDVPVKLTAADGTNTVLKYNRGLKVWEGELDRGIEQDIEIHIADKNYKFRTVPTTRMGDDLFDD